MSRQIQIRRGTTSKHQKFTGAVGEVTMDTTKNTLRVHDGKTVGGNEMLSRNGFYSYITNCITEIPQDIKLELSDGTLRLKSGSCVYIPNGANNFDALRISTDKSVQYSQNGQRFVHVNQYGYLAVLSGIAYAVSGETDPLAGQTYHTWYDTANNIINQYSADTAKPAYTVSLPIALVTISNGVISSIDRVFNGFGYIGSTIFALPGVKGLIPNGRNVDGTLKNIIMNNTSVKTVTKTSSATAKIVMTQSGTIDAYITFNYSSDVNFNCTSGGDYTNRLHAGTVAFGASGAVTSFEPKSVFSFIS